MTIVCLSVIIGDINCKSHFICKQKASEDSMDKKTKIAIVGIVIAILVLTIGIGVTVVKRIIPSKEIMPLNEYYQVKDNEV